MTNEEKADIVVEHFVNKYDLKKCAFIMSKIGAGSNKFSPQELIEIGEKIALFNGWTTVDELNKLGIK